MSHLRLCSLPGSIDSQTVQGSIPRASSIFNAASFITDGRTLVYVSMVSVMVECPRIAIAVAGGTF